MNTELFRGLLDRFQVFSWPEFQAQVEYHKDPHELKKMFARRIVVQSTGNPWDMQPICDFLRSTSSNDVVQTVLVNDHDVVRRNPDLKLCHFPAIGIGTVEELKRNHYRGKVDWCQRRHIVSCLNHQTRPHRTRLAYLIHKKNLDKFVYFSFAGLPSSTVRQAGAAAAKWFADNQHRFPILASDQDHPHVDMDPFAAGFADSYLNLCTETSVDNFCPSEKTWKHITAGCLNITMSCPLFYEKMHRIGFDLKFDHIDVDSFDHAQDWTQVVDQTADILEKILHHIPDIWHANLAKLKHNHGMMFSGEWTEPFYQNLKHHLE